MVGVPNFKELGIGSVGCLPKREVLAPGPKFFCVIDVVCEEDDDGPNKEVEVAKKNRDQEGRECSGEAQRERESRPPNLDSKLLSFFSDGSELLVGEMFTSMNSKSLRVPEGNSSAAERRSLDRLLSRK
jgi:hypothetical protein